jgi:hypothetical protein
MLRQKTYTEQQRLRSYFQNLNTSQVMVSGETSYTYNCVSWSVGINSRWLWPGNTLSDFDYFYSLFGYERTMTGTIAVWGHDSHTITHVSILVPDSQPDWESKCGADIRLRHQLNEFKGPTYGRVIAFYSPVNVSDCSAISILEKLDKKIEPINKEHLQLLKKQIQQVPKKTIIEFEKQFEDWRNSWFSGRLAINSNPTIRTTCYEFFRLVKMGEVIIPLIMQKLIEKENFFALQLYAKIQPNSELIAEHNLFSENFLSGEQGLANKNLQLYLQSLLCQTEKIIL